jgi:hypothetical protein
MFRTRLFALTVVFAVVVSFIGGGAVPAFAAVSTGFDGYGTGTPAEALGISGVSFDGGGVWTILTSAVPPFTALTVPALAGRGQALTMSFSESQSSYSFVFALDQYVSGSIGVRGFLAGTEVFSATFSAVPPASGHFPEGAAAGSGVAFDTLVIPGAAVAIAIDNLATGNADAPGCDAVLLIPSQAVMGQFVADAPVYWGPDSSKTTGLTIQVGKTYRVIGQDASGQYRQIILQCQFVWVPANTVGPDPDSVWNNRPLPTTVVQ